MLKDNILVSECIKHNSYAQRELYDRYAPKMRAICFRYASSADEAKDILQDAFIKIFQKLGQFSGSGSLEGWIKRIVINTAIESFNRRKKCNHVSIDEVNEGEFGTDGENASAEGIEVDKKDFAGSFSLDLLIEANLTKEELTGAMNKLPEIFRLVFNLFFIENYSHKEISEILGIDETTSRTRVLRARKLLQKEIYGLTAQKICR
jgi:RNA polymerase sigma-70 factor, ECF subfamily